MTDKIKVGLPVNAQESLDLLSSGIDYKSPVISISNLDHVFLNRSGIILNGMRLVKESVPPYHELYKKFHSIGMFSRLIRQTKKIDNQIPYIVAHNIWSGGYFHWITEVLVKLWAVKEQCEHGILLLPSHTKIQPVIEESVRALGYSKIEYLPENKNLKVAKIILVNNTLKQAEYHVDGIFGIRDLFRAKDSYPKIDYGELIYITREKASRRKVVNEGEVTSYLKTRGFSVVRFEDHSFGEQVSIMKRAKVLISIHGAALTNVLFMDKGCHVLEFYKDPSLGKNSNRLTSQNLPSYCYRRLAPLVGLEYLIQFCQSTKIADSVDRADLVVDLNNLEENLRTMGI